MASREHEDESSSRLSSVEPTAGDAVSDPQRPNLERNEARQPARLVFDWKVLPFVVFGFLLIIAPAVCQEMREGPILRSGTPAKARVLAIEPTGGSYNDDQEVEIDLEVQPAGEEAYRAQVETYLHPVHFPRYQPGAMVDVRFDPKKRRDVVLVRP